MADETKQAPKVDKVDPIEVIEEKPVFTTRKLSVNKYREMRKLQATARILQTSEDPEEVEQAENKLFSFIGQYIKSIPASWLMDENIDQSQLDWSDPAVIGENLDSARLYDLAETFGENIDRKNSTTR